MRGRMTTHVPFVAKPADPLLAASLAPASTTALQILSRLAAALGRQAAREQFAAAGNAAHCSADQPEVC